MRTVPRLFVAALAFLASLEAAATVTLLPGSSPQRVVSGERLAPIIVRVTDSSGAPVPGAQVRANIYDGVRVEPPFPRRVADCIPDIGGLYACNEGITDADGLAQIRALSAFAEPRWTPFVTIWAEIDNVSFGRVDVQVTVVPAGPRSLKLLPVDGLNQQAPVGLGFARSFVARVVGLDGKPVVGVPVIFAHAYGPDVEFIGNPEGTALSDQDGFATSPLAVAKAGIGAGAIRATVFDEAAQARVTTDFEFRALTPDGRTDRELEDMWWSGFQQNGWGISIAQREDRLFPVIYAYDDNGNPTWRVLPVGRWVSDATHYERYLAFQYAPRGSPYYAYDAQLFKVGPQGSAVNFDFTSEQSATMELTAPAPSLTKAITRQDFRSEMPAPLVGIGGMWWGGQAQAGWGISLMQQPGGLFAVWFTYGANGDPTWFVMPEGRWENSTTYSGTLYKTRSSPFFGAAPYDPSKLQVFPVGAFVFRFTDLDRGTFEYEAEGHRGSMKIERQYF